MQTKYIFVTGGVVSGLGKGITAASLGRLLKDRGYKVTVMKCDPYINVDPGTMSPYQHGEVFVTDDGTETDLDLGHYERFIDENLSANSNVTTGKIYQTVINKERRGDYLGATVQVVPHITNEIKSRIYRAASSAGADIVITEMEHTLFKQPYYYRYCAGFAREKTVIIAENPYGGIIPRLLELLDNGRGYDLYRIFLHDLCRIFFQNGINFDGRFQDVRLFNLNLTGVRIFRHHTKQNVAVDIADGARHHIGLAGGKCQHEKRQQNGSHSHRVANP